MPRMPYFKAKKAILLMGIFFISGCSLSDNKIVSNTPDKLQEKIQNKIQESPRGDVSILFVGDLMFDRSIRQFAEKKGNDFIFEQIAELLKENDLVVANLEGPITNNRSKSINTTPEQKEHFVFTFDKSLAGTLAKNNIKLVNLGNNHILNFSQDGLLQTESYLKESGIDYFGNPISKEKKYALKEFNGIKIGFINYNQFGGKADEIINNIKSIKEEVDIFAVYAHWGKEYEKIPSGNIKDLAHKFIDAGADLIVGSHPHVVQDMEEYKEKRIYYSLGNFIFDQYFSAEPQKGLAIQLKINSNDSSFNFKKFSLFMDKNGQTKLLLPK